MDKFQYGQYRFLLWVFNLSKMEIVVYSIVILIFIAIIGMIVLIEKKIKVRDRYLEGLEKTIAEIKKKKCRIIFLVLLWS